MAAVVAEVTAVVAAAAEARLVHADRSILKIDVTSVARRATTPTSVIATTGDVNQEVVEGWLLEVMAAVCRQEVVADRPTGRVGAEVAEEAILVAEVVVVAAVAPLGAVVAPRVALEVPGVEAAPPGVEASPVALHRGRLVHP